VLSDVRDFVRDAVGEVEALSKGRRVNGGTNSLPGRGIDLNDGVRGQRMPHMPFVHRGLIPSQVLV
jgi:hypothetical protein